MKNFIWSFVHSASLTGLSTVFVILLGNLMDPGEVGTYVAILLLVNFMVNFLSLRIGGALVQKINDAKLANDRNLFFTAGWISVTLFGFVAMFIFWVFRFTILDLFELAENSRLVFAAVPLVFLQLQRTFFSRVLEANLMFKGQALSLMTADLLKIIFALIFLRIGWNLEGVIISIYIADGTGTLAMLVQSLRKHRIVFERTSFPVLWNLLKFSAAMFIGSMAVFLDQRIDLFFVNYYLDKDQVAIYNYAIKLPLMCFIISNSLSRVTYPGMTRAFTSGAHDRIERIFSNCLDFSYSVISLILLVFIIHAPYIIGAILPEKYIVMVPIISILACGILLKATVRSVGTMLTSKGMPYYGAIFNWVIVLVNAGLNLILIPKYGLAGAAVATSVSFAMKPFFVFAVAKFKLNISYKYAKLTAGYLVFVTIVSCHSLAWDSILWSELAILIYAMGLVFFFLDSPERKNMTGWLKLHLYKTGDS